MKQQTTTQQEWKQRQLKSDINRFGIKPFSFEAYKKTPKEQAALATAKSNHKRALRNAGFDPKKRLNLSEPMILGRDR